MNKPSQHILLASIYGLKLLSHAKSVQEHSRKKQSASLSQELFVAGIKYGLTNLHPNPVSKTWQLYNIFVGATWCEELLLGDQVCKWNQHDDIFDFKIHRPSSSNTQRKQNIGNTSRNGHLPPLPNACVLWGGLATPSIRRLMSTSPLCSEPGTRSYSYGSWAKKTLNRNQTLKKHKQTKSDTLNKQTQRAHHVFYTPFLSNQTLDLGGDTLAAHHHRTVLTKTGIHSFVPVSDFSSTFLTNLGSFESFWHLKTSICPWSIYVRDPTDDPLPNLEGASGHLLPSRQHGRQRAPGRTAWPGSGNAVWLATASQKKAQCAMWSVAKTGSSTNTTWMIRCHKLLF